MTTRALLFTILLSALATHPWGPAAAYDHEGMEDYPPAVAPVDTTVEPEAATPDELTDTGTVTDTTAAPADAPTPLEPVEAPVTPPAEAVPPLPSVLSADDADRYRKIFRLQKAGRWKQADYEIRKLKDKILLGHVLGQRYLHPTRYRSRYKELAGWLRHYADHPESRRIYRLALKRKPGKARKPRRPRVAQARDYLEYPWEREVNYSSPRRRSASKRREARRLVNKIRILSRRYRLTAARGELRSRHARRTLDPVEQDIARAYIGRGYFFWGDAKKAYEFTGPAATRLGRRMPMANWTAGLAAFQLGKHREAADHFEALAGSGRGSGWTLAAAGFWAARTNMIAGRPDRTIGWLQAAAVHSRTFYGQLAARVLGRDVGFDWDVPGLTQDRIDAILDHRAGRRGLALLQIGQARRAEQELRSLTAVDDAELGRALLALADHVRMPSLALKTASMLIDEDGAPLHGALYPVPNWRPKEGFTVDRALVFAFMRQESRFNTRAKSRAGARGLMQLMPATAGFIARKRFRGRRRNQLYDPAVNISLGQKYLKHLIAHNVTKGDMLMVAAAYNGGPGNLAKWRRRLKRRRFVDPLLIIEAIPSQETRVFIERVLANLWIYRHRLGQPSPTLDLLAAGKPAVYKSLDDTSVAQNVRN